MDVHISPSAPSSSSRLTLAIANVARFEKKLMTMLGASSVSVLAFVVRLTLTKVERSVYLNPIRYISEDTGWIDNEIRHGSRVTIAGIDVKTMMDRIRDSTMYWTTRELEIWLIIPKRLRLVRGLHSCSSRRPRRRPPSRRGKCSQSPRTFQHPLLQPPCCHLDRASASRASPTTRPPVESR